MVRGCDDAHVTVIDAAGGYEWDFWEVQTDVTQAPNPPEFIAAYGNRIPLCSNGI